MADAPECIVIGVDNSRWVPIDSDIFRDLCDAIEFYCRAKFNENSDTVVGLYTMSSVNPEHLVYPTGSIEELVAKFPAMNTGSGQVDLLSMFTFGCMPLTQHSLFSQHKNKKKRVVLFVAGLTNLSLLSAEETAMACRGKGIAIDVIDLYTGGPTRYPISNYSYGRNELAALIKMRNDNDGNDNCHIVHVG
uniref:uncharacterized protein LOC122582939 n=1 Tax=Erigeron canadensis TaxID=72917 RepID=UPI001CB8AB97|nr:uncharacterized protein LOC122582939 [Erigeron canadensis]XP_043611305.1 uncharacterized protein LOC122582939 [Erigeron canadensis]